ncbi:MAG: hypothetical protein ABI574_04765 [Burkholderiales bacterium]
MSAHGAEELSASRTLRHLAVDLAGAGLPTLRFDLDGCGDAAGDDLDPGRVPAWLASIGTAIDALRSHSGCRRGALVGLRLGALLAAQLARARPDVVLWAGVAPVVSGRQYLRELLALGALHPAQGTVNDAEPLLEAAGFAYTRATREALAPLGLEALVTPVPGARQGNEVGLDALRLHIFQRDEMPVPARVLAPLHSGGSTLTVHGFTGFAAMMDLPHASQVPQALLAQLRHCLLAASAPAGAMAPPPRGPRFGRMQARWDAIVERVVQPLSTATGPAGFGVLSLPGAGQPMRGSVLLLNAGAIRHVGPSRLHAKLARRWAARGMAVLRLDLSGLGESAPQPGQTDNQVYSTSAVAEVVEAARWLAYHTGIERCQVVGLCAGAYHALQAAMAGAAVEQVVAINPLVFHYDPAVPITSQAMNAYQAGSVAAVLSGGWRDAGLWQRVWRGQLPWAKVSGLLAGYVRVRLLRWLQSMGCAAARLVGKTRPCDLGAHLEALAARQVQMSFVFATGEPGPQLLAQLGGRRVRVLERTGALRQQFIADADHTFTRHAARQRLMATLDQLVLPDTAPDATAGASPRTTQR